MLMNAIINDQKNKGLYMFLEEMRVSTEKLIV